MSSRVSSARKMPNIEALMAARREAGMTCPSCGHERNYLCGRRVGCTRSNHRWSVMAGTVMSGTRLPLTTWFRAMHIMTSTKQGVSAIELGCRLGVRYPTAWYLAKRLRRAMTERKTRYFLGGSGPGGAPVVVEAGDVYLGGKRNQGSGPGGKTRVIAATERYESGRMVIGFASRAVRAFADTCLMPAVRVHTDGLKALLAFGTPARSHVVTVNGSRCPSRQRTAPFHGLNTAIANLGTALKATHKAVAPQHISGYLGAFC
ncbi:IS1595 family transposase [Komagataeibacter xylinus]|uniref:IS1595 family transposase n=1 Tax=Komagataeibacter xylinus TaxID=28448 RepID=UPI001F5C38B9|nr:IS1595 family transposase [Komagataeibacter xylinus]